MIGGGDESVFVRVPKGTRILTPNGYITAGETLEENKQKWEQKIKDADKRWEEFNKKQKSKSEKRLIKKLINKKNQH